MDLVNYFTLDRCMLTIINKNEKRKKDSSFFWDRCKLYDPAYWSITYTKIPKKEFRQFNFDQDLTNHYSTKKLKHINIQLIC